MSENIAISIKRKAVKPGGHLPGSIALFALQPPDDGADQDMGELHDRQFLGHGWIDLLPGFHLVFPQSLALKRAAPMECPNLTTPTRSKAGAPGTCPALRSRRKARVGLSGSGSRCK
jgi:hypothetical protein